VPPPRSETRRIVGLSLVEAMRRLHPEGDAQTHRMLDPGLQGHVPRPARGGMVGEPLYDGIAALVEDLAQRGWLLGVATGKSDRGLAHCLATHGLRATSSRCKPPTATRPSRIPA
jgi:phosphoglycolate phosphatase